MQYPLKRTKVPLLDKGYLPLSSKGEWENGNNIFSVKKIGYTNFKNRNLSKSQTYL